MKNYLITAILLIHFSCLSFQTKPIIVYVDVIGDILHAGHVEFFRQAKDLGDYLIVGIINDEDATTYKRKPIFTLEERQAIIKSCSYVDEVIINAPVIVTKDIIDKYGVNIVAHGDDFSDEAMNEYYKIPIEMGILRVIPYTKGISTTEIINRIKMRDDL